MKRFCFAGFTLAEILIVLGIIGVVAAMTIPTLISSTNDLEYKVAYKKAYSTASQAWSLAITNDKMLPRSSWDDIPTNLNNFAAFKSEFNITKDCDSSNNSDCWAAGEMFATNYPDSSAMAFIDKSGMSWSLRSNGTGSAEIFVDVNGLKKPNKWGQDRFPLQPVAEGGSAVGLPIFLRAYPDCNSVSDCPVDYACPSIASHSCYFTKWIID